MTPGSIRSRFASTLAFEPMDRPMVDYMAELETDGRLRKTLGCESEEELLDVLGAEFFYLPGRDLSQNEGFMPCYRGRPLTITSSERMCPLGIRFTRGAYESKFTVDHALAGPLEGATSPQEILDHPWPGPKDFDFEPLGEVAESHRDRIIVGGLWSGILGDAVRLFGFQRFLTDIALRPRLVHTLVDRLTEVYLELNERLFTVLQGVLDIYFFGNDFGTQQGLLMSTEMWQEFYFHNVRRLCDLAHSHGLTVMMHSCGAVSPLIPLLIQAGVDILDPVQTSAKGMDPVTLGKEYGGRIVFHGGVDTQHILPERSAGEVAAHVEEVGRSLGRYGGYIKSGSQLLGPDIPMENILAMYGIANAATADRIAKSS